MTYSQLIVLQRARVGKDFFADVSGMSASGGRTSTVSSCRRKGWLLIDTLTPSGRAALQAEEERLALQRAGRRKP